MKLATLYLILALAGAVVPYLFFLDFIAARGVDLPAFVAALFANGASGGFTMDLLISSLVFWIYMFSRQDAGPKAWPFILVNLAIGLSCALPAYFWACQRTAGAAQRG